jgi:hypothetical protein
VHQSNDRWDGYRPTLRAENGAVAIDDLGLLLEHQNDRAAGWDDAQRLEAGVEQERPGHG